jgi:hypothetical protein
MYPGGSQFLMTQVYTKPKPWNLNEEQSRRRGQEKLEGSSTQAMQGTNVFMFKKAKLRPAAATNTQLPVSIAKSTSLCRRARWKD